MGKLMHNTQLKHSSHPHLLQLSLNQSNNNNNATCAGCNLSFSSSDHHIYACPPCNFFLHPSCSKFPELITHPFHPQHTLSLLPSPIYPGGFFQCDACAQQGSRFSYHCQFCDVDLHVLCASKPLSVNHPLHAHPIVLTFSSPYGEKSGFSCDVCRSVGSPDQWLYRCVSCEFDVHLHCATVKTQTPLQHSHSYSGVGHQNQFVHPQPLSHSFSTGHVQTYSQTQPQASVGFQSYQGPPQLQPQTAPGVQSYQMQPQAAVGVQGYQMQPQAAVGVQGYQMQQPQAAVGVQGYQMQPQAAVGVQGYQMQPKPPMPAAANQNVGPNNGLADVMVSGFVDGMMQQLGQDFVQSLTGGGGGGGCGGGGGGDVVNVEFECSNDDYDN